MTNPVARDAAKLTPVLQEDLGGSLGRVNPNAVVCEDRSGVPVDLELLCNVLENGCERRLPRHVYPVHEKYIFKKIYTERG